MKNLILAFCVAILALSLGSCSDNNELKGTFPNGDNDGITVYLLSAADSFSEYNIIDSTIVEGDHFTLKRTITDTPSVHMVFIPNIKGSFPQRAAFINDKGNITLTYDTIVRVSGTPLNEEFQLFQDKSLALEKQMIDFQKQAMGADENTIASIREKVNALQTEYKSTAKEFITNNISTPIGEFFLIAYADLLGEEFPVLLAKTNPVFSKKVENMMTTGISEQQSQAGLEVGATYLDIKGQNPDGKEIRVSDYVAKNKVVMIDFWASWCGPCIKEMPSVKAAYDKYKSKGFEIVGISLDQEKSAWTEAISRLGLTWPQMSDLKGWDSELSAPYQVQSIPATYLIGADGKILAKDLRSDQLEKKLAELLK